MYFEKYYCKSAKRLSWEITLNAPFIVTRE
jgi:hypothetical protein